MSTEFLVICAGHYGFEYSPKGCPKKVSIDFFDALCDRNSNARSWGTAADEGQLNRAFSGARPAEIGRNAGKRLESHKFAPKTSFWGLCGSQNVFFLPTCGEKRENRERGTCFRPICAWFGGQKGPKFRRFSSVLSILSETKRRRRQWRFGRSSGNANRAAPIGLLDQAPRNHPIEQRTKRIGMIEVWGPRGAATHRVDTFFSQTGGTLRVLGHPAVLHSVKLRA